MQIKVINVMKVREPFVLEGQAEYLKRLPKHFSVACSDLGIGGTTERSPEVVKRRESELFLSKINPNDRLVLLDEKGVQLSSLEFTTRLKSWKAECRGDIVFGIGGPYGWSEEMRSAGHFMLSLGKLTLPHQLARLLLVEQLYRAYTLSSGLRYHKE